MLIMCNVNGQVLPTSRVTSLKEHNSQTQEVVFSGRMNSSRTNTTAFFVDSKPVKLVLVKEVSMYFQCELRTSRLTSKKYAESEMTAGQLMFYQEFSLYRIFMQQTQFITRNVASTFAPENVYHPQHQIKKNHR